MVASRERATAVFRTSSEECKNQNLPADRRPADGGAFQIARGTAAHFACLYLHATPSPCRYGARRRRDALPCSPHA